IAWHAESTKIDHDPSGVTADKVEAIAAALTRDFDVSADARDAQREAELREVELLAEQRFALELVGSNPAVYFDGPAGTGKSHLIERAALESVQRGEKTLLTCWNVVMADRLRHSLRAAHGPAS